MAKRPAVSFPELEARGRRAILRTPEEVHAEEELLESQHSNVPESQKASISERQNAGTPALLQDGNRALYRKATYRLSSDALDAIDEAKRLLWRQYRLRVSREEIAEGAILAAYHDLLENQNASTLVHQLSSKPENQTSRSNRSR